MKSQIKITKLPKCSSKLNQWILHALHTLEEEKKTVDKGEDFNRNTCGIT